MWHAAPTWSTRTCFEAGGTLDAVVGERPAADPATATGTPA